MATDAPTRAFRSSTLGRVLFGFAVVLTGVFVVLSSVAVWLHQTVFDTEEFVDLVAPVIESPDTKRAVADYLTDAAIEAIDIEARVDAAVVIIQQELIDSLLAAAGLPDRVSDVLDERASERLEALAGIVTGAVNSAIARSVDAVAFSPEFEELIIKAVTRAHEYTVALVRGDFDSLPNTIVEGGEVKLNLVPLIGVVVNGIIERVGGLIGIVDQLPSIDPDADAGQAVARIAEALGTTLPDDFGQVTVMSVQSLEDIQAYARWFDRLVWFIVLVTIALIGAVLWMSGSLLRGLAWVSGAGLVGLFLGRLIVERVTLRIENAFAPGYPTVGEVIRSVTDSLDRVTTIVVWIMVALGLVALFQTWREDRAANADAGFLTRNMVLLRAGLVVLAVVALAQIGLGWWSVVIVGAALAAALWWLSTAARDEARAAAA
jgi:hypothetical protein